MTDILSALNDLDLARNSLENAKAQQKLMLDALKANPDYIAWEAAIKDYSAKVDEADKLVRDLALKAYATDKDKKPNAWVEIKTFKVATILDPERAREWCLHNFTPALKLDTKAVEKAAIAGSIPSSIATVSEEPRAQIASDLSDLIPF